MILRLDQPSILAKAVEIISELVSEVKIRINEFGMNITAMDPANVAMVSFKLPKNTFSQFELSTEEGKKEEILGVNLDNLKQILKRCSPGSSLILETKDNILSLQIQDRIKRNFTLVLIDIEAEDKEMPSLEFSSRIEINSVDLIASIEDCLVVGDACSFIVKDEKFIIEAKGLNSAMSEFSSDEAKINAENCKSKYSLEYLQKFMKGVKLVGKTILNFAEDYPLKMEIKNDQMELVFILAPRVETED